MSVPDTNSFNQRDVVTEIYGDSSNRTLTELFSNATGIFDSNYVGAKNSLYNFRNYLHILPNGGYGRLYNGYAINDSRNIAPSGWHVPTTAEISILLSTIGGYLVAGGYLKELTTIHWFSPNSGADNSYSFSAVGNGYRNASGLFGGIKTIGTIGASFDGTYYKAMEIYHNQVYTSTNGANAYSPGVGIGVRLIKDDSTNTGIMTDNSGYTYKTVKIGSQVWMASNLRGTKYRNGNDIPIVTDNAAWVALSTGACCSYNNNDTWSYADNYIPPSDKTTITLTPYIDASNYIGVYADQSVHSNLSLTVKGYSSNNTLLGTVFMSMASGASSSFAYFNKGIPNYVTLIAISPTSDSYANYVANNGLLQ